MKKLINYNNQQIAIKILYIAIFLLFIDACKPKPSQEQEANFTKGVFVVNEGNFMANNGEISFYNIETGELTNNIFAKQNNGAILGDVVQSMCISDSFGLISVNNSKKVEVVNINSFKHIATITNLSYPRYIIPVRKNICYLTNGKNQGELCVINISEMQIQKRITLGKEPENLLFFNNKVFVVNGAWGHDSTVSIINAQTDEFIKTINVGDGATDLVSDKNGNIWVLCQGKTKYDFGEDTPSKLVCINPDTYEKITEVTIGILNDDFYPTRIASNKKSDFIYYIEKYGVYKLNINNPQEKELLIKGSYYGFEINPENENIYVFFDNGFSGSGIMTIYNKVGNKILNPTKVGIGCNGAIFN